MSNNRSNKNERTEISVKEFAESLSREYDELSRIAEKTSVSCKRLSRSLTTLYNTGLSGIAIFLLLWIGLLIYWGYSILFH